uniref:Uncharacterized protein n=1 Tax=Pipistrellus kuhlii TaxID=59472 RepID=A0A7J7ZIY1_PIPKU|nr:hypothetical protein mPipKuh1_009448 [Pipistrellus kuhlii]
MLCPPREPGLCSPLSPLSLSPLLNPTSIKSPSPQPWEAVGAASGGATASGDQVCQSEGPGPGWPHTVSPSPPQQPGPIYGWSGPRQRDLWGKEGRMEPAGGKNRGRNLKNSSVKGFNFILLVKNYGFLMFQSKRDRDTEGTMMRLCVRSGRRNWSP